MFGDVRGCSEVLVSFQSENAVARTLYESLGFRERSRGGGKVTAALDFAG
jgi:ribosomal protein S18 acetylase RimI-like enzyme